MRGIIQAFALPVLLLLAPAAIAAPTCRDQNGDTIKCGVSGAMPVGWTLSPEQSVERQISQPDGIVFNDVMKIACGLGLFLALLALLPEFDGSHASDWDRQEDDDDWR